MTEERYEFTVAPEEEGRRLDAYLAQKLPDYSRSFLQKNIKSKAVLINGKAAKASYKVMGQDQIVFEAPEPVEPEIVPENIPLDILYEDDDVIVINKPKQVVVHPAPGHYTGTIVNALMYHCKDSLSGINGVMRPGIVHRIDQDTTGVIVACKNDYAHQCIAEQLKEHSITRRYHAIVLGSLAEDGTVEGKIGRHPVDRKKMAINEKTAKKPSHIIIFWMNSMANTLMWNASLRRDARIRSVCIWQALVIRFWEIRYMVRKSVRSG